jgi:hypothetical protein
LTVADVCDVTLAVMMQRVEANAQAAGASAGEARANLTTLLEAEPERISGEQAELRHALGVL